MQVIKLIFAEIFHIVQRGPYSSLKQTKKEAGEKYIPSLIVSVYQK